ncbi:hypothetical protein NDN94_07565 [Burkholderia glumae]|nr:MULTISPECIES: S24 family peptidase [Burkholderia]MCM2537684.1 hypothetical protein [Burkholderia glumae]
MPKDTKHIGSRLREEMEARGLAVADIAQMFGVKAPSVYDWLNFGRIAKKHLPKLVAEFGHSMQWWIEGGDESASNDGDSDKKLTGGRDSVSARPLKVWESESDLGDDYVLIPRLDIKFSAGNGRIVWHVDQKSQKQAFRKSWCMRLGINPEHAATIIADGSSMEPRVLDGDSLVVDYKALHVLDGKVYALAYQNEVYVKRLFKKPDGGLRVASDNADKVRYPDMDLSAEQVEYVQIIGRVVAISGAM